MFEFSGRNLAVGIHVEQVESLLQVLLCHQLVEVRGRSHELRVLDLPVPVQVDLLHDLVELSLEEHLLAQELLEALADLIERKDAVVVRIKLLEDREKFVLILLSVHAVRNISHHRLLELPLAVEVLQLCQGTRT